MRRADLARWVLAGTLILAATAAAWAANEGPELLFKIDERRVELAEAPHHELRDRADTILRGCSYDAGDREDQVWQDALAEASSIRLSYAEPVMLRLPRREILVSEAVFSLGDPGFLGSPVLRHADRTTLVFKCSGTHMLELICMPGMEAHFPPDYQRNCDIVRRE